MIKLSEKIFKVIILICLDLGLIGYILALYNGNDDAGKYNIPIILLVMAPNLLFSKSQKEPKWLKNWTSFNNLLIVPYMIWIVIQLFI